MELPSCGWEKDLPSSRYWQLTQPLHRGLDKPYWRIGIFLHWIRSGQNFLQGATPPKAEEWRCSEMIHDLLVVSQDMPVPADAALNMSRRSTVG
ncbi:hypothetical protein FKM82_023148 [Ascaphus truei]